MVNKPLCLYAEREWSDVCAERGLPTPELQRPIRASHTHLLDLRHQIGVLDPHHRDRRPAVAYAAGDADSAAPRREVRPRSVQLAAGDMSQILAQRRPDIRLMHARLPSGRLFQIFQSPRETASYISNSLFNCITPRPQLTSPGSVRLRFNDRIYECLGHASFTLFMTQLDETGREKVLELKICASVVDGLEPDLFIGQQNQLI